MGLVWMPIKSLTHSALKELCHASDLHTTSDVTEAKENKKEIQRLITELAAEKEKSLEFMRTWADLYNELKQECDSLKQERDSLKQENDRNQSNKRLRTE